MAGVVYPLSLLLSLIVSIARADYSFTFDGTVCPALSFFDVSGLKCQACGTNAVVRADGAGCECLSGYALALPASATSGSGLDFGTCTSCLATNQASSLNRTYCVTCDATSGAYWSPATLITSTDAITGLQVGQCACANSDGEIAEVDAAGVPFVRTTNGVRTFLQRCIQCQPNSVVSNGQCFTCPYPQTAAIVNGAPTCSCPAPLPAGARCSVGSDLDYLATALGVSTSGYATVTLRQILRAPGVVADAPVDSLLYKQLLPTAARACLDAGDRASCEAVANLCVLQMYDDTTPACQMYRKLADLRKATTYYPAAGLPWPETLPWLLYNDVPATFLRAKDVALRTTLAAGARSAASQTGVGQLSLVASTYAVNGTWLGLRPLTGQLQLCGTPLAEARAWEQVGQNFVRACSIDVADIVASYASVYGVELFDLYLYDGPTRLYPLPIVNFDQRKASALVNRVSGAPGQLTRRLFAVDAAVGVQTAGAAPLAVRFLQSARIVIQMREDVTGAIFPPYIEISYTARDPSLSDTARAAVPASVSFTVEWSKENKKWKEFNQAILITCVVLAGVYWLIKLNSVLKLRREQALELRFLYRALAEGTDIFGTAILIHLWIQSMYWLAFYKTQKSSYAMIPSESDFKEFALLLVIATIFKVFGVFELVRRQLNYDVIFLDWEKPKKLLAAGGAQEVAAPTSCWRTMLVANEFNELQSLRKTSPGFTFLLLIALLEGAKWGGIGLVTPDEKLLEPKTYLSTHFVLRFAIASLVYLAIAGTQLLLKSTIIKLYFNDPLGNFVDLCYLANISVFALDERCSGYYIHGRNGMRMSDTDFLGLSEELRKEEQQSVGARGLIPTHADRLLRENQAFEIYIDSKTRFTYEDTLVKTLERALELQKQSTGLLGRLKSPELASSAQLQAMRKASAFIKQVIAEVEANFAERVLTRSLLQRLVPAPPVFPSAAQIQEPPVLLVHDLGSRFGSMFLYNRELTLVFMEFLVFIATDTAITNFAAAAFVAYLVGKAIKSFRSAQGTHNVSRKSLIDARFLI